MEIDAPWRACRFEECGEHVASGIAAVSVRHAGRAGKKLLRAALPLCRAHPMTVAMRGSLSRPQRSLHHESRIARILQFAGAAAMDSN